VSRVVIMDYPTAWAYVRERAHKYGTREHDPKCSFVQAHGGFLCDCHVLNDEYDRRKAAAGAEPDRDDSDAVPHV
jgi:hypothetical protein